MRDVIIVGAGAGGPVVAKELAARGLDVLVLEGGPRHRDVEAEWSRYENDANSLIDGYFRVGPTGRFERPAWFRETPQASHLWQVAGVGGTTLHYYANSLRAMPGAFVGYEGPDRDAYDTAHPFPFPYRELLPYYEWVEETLPVAPAAMGTKEEVFFRGAQRIGLPLLRGRDQAGDSYRPQPNAILQPQGTAGRTTDPQLLRFPAAQGCTLCGYCFQGCVIPRGAPRNLKAKRSTDNSYVPMAETADEWAPGGRAAEIRADSYVTRVHSEERGGELVATGVRWRDGVTGEHHDEEARVVVLAGGCTETPRLWLNSGLPDPNGWVGRGYTDHAFDWVFGVFDEYTGSSKGTGSSARADYPGRGGLEHVGLPPALQAFATTFSDSGVQGHYDKGRGVTGAWDGVSGRLLGNDLKAALSDVDRVLNIVTLTDDDVEWGNRVVLSSLPADEHGPIPKVVFSKRNRSRRTRENREFLANRAAELIRAAGARRVYRVDWPPLILHVQSSMRMGHDERDSVLDDSGEARWVKRLFVADNSALPNAIGGPNPTLTTQALVTRTAELIAQRYFDLDPWVATEAPVVSTDPSVTAAVVQRDGLPPVR
jgi:choline dehydrogenase-like flavoprotein